MMKTYLESNEVELMEKVAVCFRDRLLIRILFHVGCRVREALSLEVKDVDFFEGTVTIEHLKARVNLCCPKCGARLGKSHKFCPICGDSVEKAVAQGYGVYFITVHELIDALARDHSENRAVDRMKVLYRPKLLIIDEMGYLPLDRMGASFFFQLVSRRYERGSIVITSNKSYGEWGSIFSDSIIASAILDRLLHHSTTINIRGESYRLWEKKKAGIFQKVKEDSKEL